MIEMSQGDDPLGEEDGDDYPYYPSRAALLWRLAFSAPSLAVASLVIAFVSLTVVQAAEEIGELVLFTSNSDNPSNLTQLSVSAAVRLVIALVAVGLAVASGLRLLTADRDDEPSDPLWVRAVAGAGLVVALLAALVAGGELIYALQAHVPPNSNFN